MSILSAAMSTSLKTFASNGWKVKQQLFKNITISSVVCFKCNHLLYSTEVPVKKKYPSYYYDKRKDKKKLYITFTVFALYSVVLAIAFTIINYRRKQNSEFEKEILKKKSFQTQKYFTIEDVIAQPTWTTFNGGVYDFSKYAAKHPGGMDTINQAGGTSLEPFWEKFSFHNDSKVMKELETLKIGHLITDKQARCKPTTNLPEIKNYMLEVVFTDSNDKIELSMEKLMSYPKYSIVSSIPCQSNSAKIETADSPIWSGTRLIDIINDLDIKMENYEKVQFECLDKDKVGHRYRISVPSEQAWNPNFDILIAYEMNHAEIPLEHGRPLRVVIPSYAGRKNIKWLKQIIFQISKKADYARMKNLTKNS